MSSSLICPQCGYSNRQGSHFCGQCGSPVAEGLSASRDTESPVVTLREGAAISSGACQRCGSANDEDAEFCVGCGGRLLVKCPQCGTMSRATGGICAGCGFDHSRFVAQTVIDALEKKGAQERQTVKAGVVSSGFMAALVVISILIAIYILRQI